MTKIATEASKGQRVYQAIVDLYNTHRPASTQAIGKLTGLKRAHIEDHVKHLRGEGKIRNLERGIYEPVFEWPEDRAISKTVLPTGVVKIEIGDQFLELTPHEVRVLGLQLYGDAMELARMRNERELVGGLIRLEQDNKEMKAWRQTVVDELAAVKKKQPDLFDMAEAAA